MTLGDEDSSLVFIARRESLTEPSLTVGLLPHLLTQVVLTYGAEGGVPPPGLRAGFLRSLVRVPPTISYSLLSGPNCASTALSTRRFRSCSSFSSASMAF